MCIVLIAEISKGERGAHPAYLFKDLLLVTTDEKTTHDFRVLNAKYTRSVSKKPSRPHIFVSADGFTTVIVRRRGNDTGVDVNKCALWE